MPDGSIAEFEFDSQVNIWAVFSVDFSPSTDVRCLTHYKQTTKTWDQIYNSTNSLVD